MFVVVAVVMPVIVAATWSMHMRCGRCSRPLPYKLHRTRSRRRRRVGMIIVAVVMPAAGAVGVNVVTIGVYRVLHMQLLP